MKAAAPGKALLTGAYAVLEGAPALVMAVDRYAVADSSVAANVSNEVREAIGNEVGPSVDVSALYAGSSKLGLGSSAAALVAALGSIRAERGDDLASTKVRDELFIEARAAHERAQHGGSGVDVAASVHGGLLRYVRNGGVRRTSLPPGIVASLFWSGDSARTSDLRARVDALRDDDVVEWRALMRGLGDASEAAARACDDSAPGAFIDAARAFADALAALGHAADAPIVPLRFAALTALAASEGGAFFPSGAGGGDVGVHLGVAPPTEDFLAQAARLSMEPLAAKMDRLGVRRLEAT